MKKTMSVFLALVMLLSGVSVFSVSAAESSGIADVLYSEETIAAAESALGYFKIENLPDRIENFGDFKESSAWDAVSLMGIDLDFLYSGTGSLLWSELDVFAKDKYDNIIYGEDGLPVMLISKDDISLAFTNIGLYLQNVIYNEYGGLNLYNVENAVGLANIVGKIFYPDFVELDPANFKNYFTNEIPSTNEFFRAVVKLSGFDKIVEANWVSRGKNFCEPVVNALGGNYITFLDDYYTNGLVLSSKLLEAAVKKIIAVGPIDYAYDLINVFSSVTYSFTYRAPLLALFTHKIPVIGAHISESELNSFNGLLQLIFCDDDCYSSKSGAVAEFCPLYFPAERIGATYDKDEALIYIYYYLNLCARYKDNYEFFENIKSSIKSNDNLTEADVAKLEALIDGLFLGDFETAINKAIIPLYKDNISTSSTSLMERVKNAFMTFLKKLADYFDYLRRILSGELDYGQGNSPFN